MRQLSLVSENDLSASVSLVNSAARVKHVPKGIERGRSSFAGLRIRADVVVTPEKHLSVSTVEEVSDLVGMMKQLSLLSQNELVGEGSAYNSAARVVVLPIHQRARTLLLIWLTMLRQRMCFWHLLVIDILVWTLL